MLLLIVEGSPIGVDSMSHFGVGLTCVACKVLEGMVSTGEL
jgi:hypothetical protein